MMPSDEAFSNFLQPTHYFIIFHLKRSTMENSIRGFEGDKEDV